MIPCDRVVETGAAKVTVYLWEVWIAADGSVRLGREGREFVEEEPRHEGYFRDPKTGILYRFAGITRTDTGTLSRAELEAEAWKLLDKGGFERPMKEANRAVPE